MTSDRNPGNKQVEAVLREWHESRRNLYAAVFDSTGMQACAGQVSSIDDDIAVITDSCVELRIPYASAGDCAVRTLDDRRRSLTLTWHNGVSAFIVRRPERERESD